jgi:hypothetical protein
MFIEDLGVEVIGGVLVVGIIAGETAAAVRMRRRKTLTDAARREAERRAEVERVGVLREQALEVARARGIEW